MVTNVVGVDATRGWRSTLIGSLAGYVGLAIIVAVLGAALTVIPIGVVRTITGALLLGFGVQWFREGVARSRAVACHSWSGSSGGAGSRNGRTRTGGLGRGRRAVEIG
jgi:uncharacterized membrane protein